MRHSLLRARRAGLYILRVVDPGAQVIDNLLLLGPGATSAAVDAAVAAYSRGKRKRTR